MKTSKKIKNCSNFKPLNEYISHYKYPSSQNCSECAYFSSRNCGFDITDNLDNETELF